MYVSVQILLLLAYTLGIVVYAPGVLAVAYFCIITIMAIVYVCMRWNSFAVVHTYIVYIQRALSIVRRRIAVARLSSCITSTQRYRCDSAHATVGHSMETRIARIVLIRAGILGRMLGRIGSRCAEVYRQRQLRYRLKHPRTWPVAATTGARVERAFHMDQYTVCKRVLALRSAAEQSAFLAIVYADMCAKMRLYAITITFREMLYVVTKQERAMSPAFVAQLLRFQQCFNVMLNGLTLDELRRLCYLDLCKSVFTDTYADVRRLGYEHFFRQLFELAKSAIYMQRTVHAYLELNAHCIEHYDTQMRKAMHADAISTVADIHVQEYAYQIHNVQRVSGIRTVDGYMAAKVVFVEVPLVRTASPVDVYVHTLHNIAYMEQCAKDDIKPFLEHLEHLTQNPIL